MRQLDARGQVKWMAKDKDKEQCIDEWVWSFLYSYVILNCQLWSVYLCEVQCCGNNLTWLDSEWEIIQDMSGRNCRNETKLLGRAE